MVVSAVARVSFSRWGKMPIPIGAWMVVLIVCGTGAGIITHLLVERPLLRRLGKSSYA
jgi:peptidoglycan/LPS O-acetylase OafA/YrhL